MKILSVAQQVVEPITLGRAVDQFLQHKRLSEGSRKVYGQVLTAFASLNDEIPLIDVDREMLMAYLDGLGEVKPATYNRHFACLNSFFTWCIHQEWIDDTPMRKLERRKEPRRLPRALETDLVGRILRGIGDARDRALFTLIYENGLRCQEALDIDLEGIDWAVKCPGICYPDLGDLIWNTAEQATLDRLDGSSRPPRPPIGRHPPYRTHDLQHE